MGDRDVIFEAKYVDKVSGPMQQTEAKVKASAQRMSTATATMVSPAASQQMRQFNERTEKARQLMTAMGGSVGGAAGQVVYYGGTLSYVIGMFSPLQLGIMGVVGAFVAMGKAMSDFATEYSGRYVRAMEKVQAINKETRDAIEDLYQSEYKAAKGRWAIAKEDLEFSKMWTETHAENLRIRIEKLKAEKAEADAWGGALVVSAAYEREIKKLNGELAKSAAEVTRLTQAEKRLADAQALAIENDKRRAKSTREVSRPEAVKLGPMDEHVRRYQEEVAHEQWRNQTILDAERSFAEQREMLWEQNVDRRERILKNQAAVEAKYQAEAAAREKEANALRMEAAAMGADAMVNMGLAVAQGNAAAIAETLKAMAVEAIARAAWHGIMALASSFWAPQEAARHGTVAGMYAAFAAAYGAGAGLASMAGGGGGGPGVAKESTGPGFYGESQERPERETTRTVVYIYGHNINTSPEYDKIFSDAVNRHQARQRPGQARNKL